MGMSSDQNENISFEEEQENLRKAEERKKLEINRPCYTTVGAINLNGKLYHLLVGKDNKWYKSEHLKNERIDKMNYTPELGVFSEEITPLTKEEFNSYFNSKSV